MRVAGNYRRYISHEKRRFFPKLPALHGICICSKNRRKYRIDEHQGANILLLHLFVATLSVGLIVIGTSTVSGQAYPSKVIRIITAQPGGASDMAARLIAQGLA